MDGDRERLAPSRPGPQRRPSVSDATDAAWRTPRPHGVEEPPWCQEGERDMTKTELERAVADAAGVEKRTAAAVLDALEEVVTSNVRKGDAVTIRPAFIKEIGRA